MRKRAENNMPPEVRRVLRRLRRRIRAYVLLEGAALLLVLVGGLFWVSVGVDYAYFKASNLDLPRWFRTAFDILVICLFAVGLVAWMGLRLIRRLRSKALALVLERRFPELDDRLVTAVELAEAVESRSTPLTAAMLQRTVDGVSRAAGSLDVGEVFEKRPLQRAVLLAAALIASVGGLAWASQETLARWKAGYVDLQHEYWPRHYKLVARVLAEPGEQVKPFQDFEYKHPRGDDLTLIFDVPESRPVPERVELSYGLANGRGGGRVLCSQVDQRRFRHSIGGLLDDVEFYVTGGDYRNRRPYRVRVVEAPRIDQVVLESRYPQYTRKNPAGSHTAQAARDPVAVQGTQVSLPMGTDFLMSATANKPLVSVRIQGDGFALRFGEMPAVAETADDRAEQTTGRGAAFLTIKSDDGSAQREIPFTSAESRVLFGPDRRSFRIPFVLATDAVSQIEELSSAAEWPVPFPPDSLLRVYLHDTDDITGSEPARLTINGIVDQPPVIESSLQGIGTSITRKAVIPVAGLITDDYGITLSRFEFKTDEDDEWQAREFANPVQGYPRRFRLQMAEDRKFEEFAVLPLDLSIGQTLTLSVLAKDGDDLNGPHAGRSQAYRFQIVSNEELLSLLYQKELNLRRRFERIVTETKQTRQDLILHRARADEREKLLAEGPETGKEAEHSQTVAEIDSAVIASAERGLHAVRKNANETKAVEESFRDVREELVNNAVETGQTLNRLDNLIVKPLHEINAKDYPDVDTAVGLFKHANDEGRDPIPHIDRSIEAMNRMISHMEDVLLEMRKLETFQEALELLKTIIEEEDKLKEATESERKRKLIEALGLD